MTRRPKVYGFDTGFVTHVRGWNEIRDTDMGILWEHLVLDMLRTSYETVNYWSDIGRNEIDFIVKGSGEDFHTIECKINPDKYASRGLHKFREFFPMGRNYCISPHVDSPYRLSYGTVEVEFRSTVPGMEVDQSPRW